MEDIDGQQIRVLGGRFIRVRQSAVRTVLVVAVALWLFAVVMDGRGELAAGEGAGAVPQVTVAPAAGDSAR